jgi:N-hydroxyarylamine O-acetyltransferase
MGQHIDVSKYLQRIKFSDSRLVDDQTLKRIHQHHVMWVPFENLDIHYKRPFDLNPSNIYNKVVNNVRGGFCYELNYLFSILLDSLGFSTRIISAKVIDPSGNPGPPFDHMCIHVKTDKEYIADVGFGDLFLHPLELRGGIQDDGRNYFRIEPDQNDEYGLFMSYDGSNFQKKYIFNLNEVPPGSFDEPCVDKQTNPESYFVKNTICTRATESGRITLFNDRLIRRNLGDKNEISILSDIDLRVQLRKHFEIEIG